MYKLRIGGEHSHTPAGHVVALAHRVELDAAFFGSGHIKNTQWFLVQDKAVWVVVYNHNIMAACKVYQLFIQFHRGVRSGRHIGIVGPHNLDAAQVHLLQFIKIGLPMVVFAQMCIRDRGWIDYLAKEKRFTTITVAGHSEGALIGMLACQNRPKVKGYISVAGAGRPAYEIIEAQVAAQQNPEAVRKEDVYKRQR